MVDLNNGIIFLFYITSSYLFIFAGWGEGVGYAVVLSKSFLSTATFFY